MKKLLLMYKVQFFETAVILGLCLILYLIFYLYSRKIKVIRSREQFISRIKFILSFAIIGLMFIIWIPGFWRFIAVLGFVLGAFVITQKSSLENLFNYFIISWRGLFIVGDVIKIGKHVGKVRALGPFYFTLSEINEENYNSHSGNIVKIPNGFVSKNPVINYSDTATQLYSLSFVFTKETNIDILNDKIHQLIKDVKNRISNTHDLKGSQHISVVTKYSIKQNEPAGIKLTLNIQTTRNLYDMIQEHFEMGILHLSQAGELSLVYK